MLQSNPQLCKNNKLHVHIANIQSAIVVVYKFSELKMETYGGQKN